MNEFLRLVVAGNIAFVQGTHIPINMQAAEGKWAGVRPSGSVPTTGASLVFSADASSPG